MSKTNQDTTCWQCGGPVKISPWNANMPDERTMYSDEQKCVVGIRSTAAEQLAELATVKQNRDTYQVRLVKATDLLSRCENLRAKWREQAHENGKQLADKEREIKLVEGKAMAAIIDVEELKDELTAAEAVVEDIAHAKDKKEARKIITEWRKLQGGDRDE